jgi:hypothetical protein
VTPRLLGYVRTAVTLGVLALLLVIGVTQGLDAVSKPFPKSEDPPVCVDNAIGRGDVLRAGSVTVSVINAGGRTGLANATLTDLVTRGFSRGELSNVPDPDVRSAQIWAPAGRSAAVRLVRTYLGGKVEIVERDSAVAGITVVVGNQFPGVVKGRFQVKVTADGTVCGPPATS